MGKPFHISLLETELTRRKEKNPRYSLRALAAFLKLDPSALSRILSGKQELSIPSALQIIQKLKLGITDQEQFITSVAEAKYLDAVSSLTQALEPQPGQLAEALRKSEERYQTLFNSMNQGVQFCELIRDPQGVAIDMRILRVNPAWENVIGVKPELIIGKRVSEWLPTLEPEWLQLCERVVRTGRPEWWEQRINGLDRWVEVYVSPMEGDHFMALSTNTTARKKQEIALRESEERLRVLANIVPGILWSSEPDGSTTWYNQRWLDYTGQTFEQSMGWGWVDAIHPDDRETSARIYRESVEARRTMVREHRIRSASGEYRWFLVRAEPTLDASGKVTKMYGVGIDIHDLRCAMEALKK
jgi:PAS domain S-box-containing protein